MISDIAIKKETDRFRKEFGLFSVTYDSLADVLEQQGYTVIEFSPDVPDEDAAVLFRSLHLQEQASHCRAFTYADDKYRLVFVQDGLSEEEKRIVLAHEQGHIRCGHMTDKPSMVGRDVIQEYEANEFAHYLLNGTTRMPTKNKVLSAMGISAVLCVLVCLCVFLLKPHPVSQFYVTRTGTKYHTADCVYVQNKDDIRILTEEELENSTYAPCGVCHPAQ